MATVYVARTEGRLVALKTILGEYARNEEFVRMFLDEARLVSRLAHPNIVRTFAAGREGATAFIAMELLAGQSLLAVWDACRARGVRLRYEMTAWIGARVAEGLQYAHGLRDERGEPCHIVHRDVNPSNVFLTYDGEVKIIDFGLAKAANRASKTATGVIKGKIAYMSPEQAMGEPVDRRTDVFALATTLWELACDRRLFRGDDEVATLERVQAARVPDPTRLVAGFPPGLWRPLERALARDREERTATAAELGRELDAFAGPAMGAAAVADVVRELFPEGRARLARWQHAPPAAAPAQAPGPGHRRVAITVLVGIGAALLVAVVAAVALSLR